MKCACIHERINMYHGTQKNRLPYLYNFNANMKIPNLKGLCCKRETITTYNTISHIYYIKKLCYNRKYSNTVSLFLIYMCISCHKHQENNKRENF